MESIDSSSKKIKSLHDISTLEEWDKIHTQNDSDILTITEVTKECITWWFWDGVFYYYSQSELDRRARENWWHL